MKRFGKIENEEDKSIFEPTGKTITRRGSCISLAMDFVCYACSNE